MKNYDENLTPEQEYKLKETLVYEFLDNNKENYPESAIETLEKKMLTLTLHQVKNIRTMVIAKPKTGLLLSVCGGLFGIDRFYAGDKRNAIFKLATLGGCGIWYIYDWFKIRDVVKDMNLQFLNNKISKFVNRNKNDASLASGYSHPVEPIVPIEPIIDNIINEPTITPEESMEEQEKLEEKIELEVVDGVKYNNGGTYDHSTGARTNYYDD